MHGRMARYTYTGDAHDLGRRIEEGMLPIFQSQPGFKGYTIAASDTELVSFSAWESAEAAEAGTRRPRLGLPRTWRASSARRRPNRGGDPLLHFSRHQHQGWHHCLIHTFDPVGKAPADGALPFPSRPRKPTPMSAEPLERRKPFWMAEGRRREPDWRVRRGCSTRGDHAEPLPSANPVAPSYLRIEERELGPGGRERWR